MNTIRRHRSLFLRIGIIIIILSIILLYLFCENFKEVVNMIAIALVISYILRPIKRLIQKRNNISNSTASLIVIVTTILLCLIAIVLLVPIIFKEINNLGPTIEKLISFLEDTVEKSKILNSSFVKYLYDQGRSKIDTIMFSMSEGLVSYILIFSENLLSLAIIPVVTYYLLADSDKISKKCYYLVPLEKRVVVRKIITDIDMLLGKYIIGQLLLSLIVGIFTFIILIVLDIKFAIALSILNGVVNIIPYFGPIVGGVPVILIALLDSPTKGLWAAVAILIIQQIEGNILSPKITGDSTNIHPLVILLLLLIGEKFGGFIGMVIAIPIGVIIKVIYEDINYYLF
ncbi:MAG TPA: AI-2E family transporter [Clostridium sp.]